MRVTTRIPSPSRAAGLGKIDESLRNGILPGKLEINDSITISDGSDRIAEYKEKTLGRNVRSLVGGITFAIPAAVLGVAGMPSNPLLGAALGAGIGLALHWDADLKDMKGEIEVVHGQVSESRSWHGEIGNHLTKPQELRTILHATGVLGDRVLPNPETTFTGEQDSKVVEDLESYKEQLQELADDRRLLAELGGKTRYGQDALQLVDAATARELLTRGRPVEVVTVDRINDSDHTLSKSAYSSSYSEKTVEAYSYTDRKLNFRLHTIASPQDLECCDEGDGLPDTTVGVPTGQSNFSQTVYKSEGQATRHRSRKENALNIEQKASRTGSAKGNGQTGAVIRTIRNMVNPSTVGYTIAGAAVGALIGIPGLVAGASATVAGTAGHFVGRAMVARAAKEH